MCRCANTAFKRAAHAVAARSHPSRLLVEASCDLMLAILLKLESPKDIARASGVNRAWKIAANSDAIWKPVCPPTIIALKSRPEFSRYAHTSYRELYRQQAISEAISDSEEETEKDDNADVEEALLQYLIGVEIRKVGAHPPGPKLDIGEGTELGRLTKVQLKNRLAEMKQPTGGSRFDLQSRLEQMSGHPGYAKPPTFYMPAPEGSERPRNGEVLFFELTELADVKSTKMVRIIDGPPGGAVTYKATYDERCLAQMSWQGCTGALLRTAQDSTCDPGTKFCECGECGCVYPEFEIRVFLLRKCDGKRLQLLTRTVEEYGKDDFGSGLGCGNDGLARRPQWYAEDPNERETPYEWLLRGTGTDTCRMYVKHGALLLPIELPAARFLGEVQYSFVHPTATPAEGNCLSAEAARQYPQTDFKEFDGDEDLEAEHRMSHCWVDLRVNGFKLSLLEEEGEEECEMRTDTVTDLLKLIELPCYAYRWV